MQPRLGVRAIPGCGLDQVGERPVSAQCKAVLSPSAPQPGRANTPLPAKMPFLLGGLWVLNGPG